jgi:hypothetical protein
MLEASAYRVERSPWHHPFVTSVIGDTGGLASAGISTVTDTGFREGPAAFTVTLG